jgi:hypothetical protein
MRRIRAVGRILKGILLELSDQRAYQRHLARHGATHSGREWRRFTERRFAAKYSRPRCC